MKKKLAMMFGNAKGKFRRNLFCPKRAGKFCAGCAKNPPNDGPNIDPKLQTNGIIENARGCNSFWGTISATIVRMIPTITC